MAIKLISQTITQKIVSMLVSFTNWINLVVLMIVEMDWKLLFENAEPVFKVLILILIAIYNLIKIVKVSKKDKTDDNKNNEQV